MDLPSRAMLVGGMTQVLQEGAHSLQVGQGAPAGPQSVPLKPLTAAR